MTITVVLIRLMHSLHRVETVPARVVHTPDAPAHTQTGFLHLSSCFRKAHLQILMWQSLTGKVWTLGSCKYWVCRVSGQQSQPVVEGSAQLRKASIYCPHLKYPMTNVHADIHMANNRLQVGCDPGAHCCLACVHALHSHTACDP